MVYLLQNAHVQACGLNDGRTDGVIRIDIHRHEDSSVLAENEQRQTVLLICP